MITDFMASAKQIKARKAFVKKYAKKGKSKYAKNIGELKKGKKLNPKSQKKVDKALANLYRKSKGKYGKNKTELKVSDIGDFMTPVKKPEFFEKKNRGKYMILQGIDYEYPMPYRDPFTGKQLIDSLDNVQRVAFLLNNQGEKVQIISS
jgi:hypothetical protein